MSQLSHKSDPSWIVGARVYCSLSTNEMLHEGRGFSGKESSPERGDSQPAQINPNTEATERIELSSGLIQIEFLRGQRPKIVMDRGCRSVSWLFKAETEPFISYLSIKMLVILGLVENYLVYLV